MIELALLVVIVATVVLAVRSGAAGSDQPIIVRSPGQYHITLAPQLGSSRGFFETVAQRLAGDGRPDGDTPTIYFQVRRTGAQAESFCLLAVAFRKGIFFIQAIVPRPLQRVESHLAALREFSDAVLLHYPPVPPLAMTGAETMDAAIEEVARKAGFEAERLVA